MTEENQKPLLYNRPNTNGDHKRSLTNQNGYSHNNLTYYPEPSRREMGSMMKSFLLIGTGAVAVAATEKFAPNDYKISKLLGSFEANIEEEVLNKTKDIETYYLAQFEEFKGEVARYVEASNTAARAQNEAVLQYYKASYERAQVLMQGMVNLRAFVVQKFVNVAETLNSADLGISSGSLAAGRLIGLFDPNLGDAFKDYGTDGGELAAQRLEEFFNRGMAINIPAPDNILPSPDEVIAELEDIETPDAPKAPKLTRYNQRNNEGE